MKGYVLTESFKRANISDAVYYAMTDADKDILAKQENTSFGDKVYIITTGETFIMGNDGQWYPM